MSRRCSQCGSTVEEFAQGGGPNERICTGCESKLVAGEITLESDPWGPDR